ncbi:Hypothetical predicted protein [Octopus vulgaris]|uniref:Uncharacterized protein n=1 Tax=Octopus vulgaris TaxID=6645 RepID=A0AA36F3D6_OCTVU|nr:Hypothetical predicted protein [Octopus vulgaris]
MGNLSVGEEGEEVLDEEEKYDDDDEDCEDDDEGDVRAMEGRRRLTYNEILRVIALIFNIFLCDIRMVFSRQIDRGD